MVVTKKQLLEKRVDYLKGVESITGQINAHAEQIKKLEADRIATVGAVQAIDNLLAPFAKAEAAAVVEAPK